MTEPLEEAVRTLAVAFSRRNVPHALIGGLAVSARGYVRATQDADFIIHAPSVIFPGLLEDLVAEGFEIDVMDVVRRWPIEKFTVFYRGNSRIDWMQPILPLYATVLSLAEPRPWLGETLRVATPEGLILTKLVAFRDRDQIDINGLLAANRDTIDLDLIRKEWAALANEGDSRTVWLEEAIVRYALTRPS